MRNKSKFSLVILSAILLSACGATSAPGTQNQAAGTPTATPTEANTSFSLRDLMGMGKDQTCTFTVSSSDGSTFTTSTKGSIYISGQKLAENLEITSSDKTVAVKDMNIISDGTYVYTWGNAEKLPGMKFKLSEITPTGTTGAAANTQNQGADLDKKMSMKCSPWTADTSKFAVPTTIKFTDISSFIEKAKANVPTMPANIPTIPSGDE